MISAKQIQLPQRGFCIPVQEIDSSAFIAPVDIVNQKRFI